MPEHALTDDEINEVQQSWDMLTRTEGGLREAGMTLNRQLLTAQPHHIRTFEQFKKYKDFDDILKSPEFKAHSYSTVREISLVITNLKHAGTFTQLTQSIGFAHRRAKVPPNQLVDFRSVFINDFIPSQMADKATPNTIKAWDKFMTVFINHVKEGLEMEVDPTEIKSKSRNKNKTKDETDNQESNLNQDSGWNPNSPVDDPDAMLPTRSIQLTMTKDKKRKKNGCCCC